MAPDPLHRLYPSEADYLVDKAQDTVEYTPGTYVPAAIVGTLCEDPLWKVIVIRFKK